VNYSMLASSVGHEVLQKTANTEHRDPGRRWDKTTGKVRPKKYLKYSNVRMKDGASYTGNIIATATPTTLTVPMSFSCPAAPPGGYTAGIATGNLDDQSQI